MKDYEFDKNMKSVGTRTGKDIDFNSTQNPPKQPINKFVLVFKSSHLFEIWKFICLTAKNITFTNTIFLKEILV